MIFLIADAPPARGAAVLDVVLANIVGAILVAGLVYLGWLYRKGRAPYLDRAASGATKVFVNLEPAIALTTLIAAIGLVLAFIGYYWDVATHIDDGRDAGPFANASHWPIVIGLAGIFSAGAIGFMMGTKDTVQRAIRISNNWHVPLGTIALITCSATSLASFPLDDIWHRLFGQDVTIWGPTHVLMIGGAALSTVALWMLNARPERPVGARAWISEVRIGGAFLIGLSALQAEYDFGVPQFRLVMHPIILALVAAVVLVAIRARLGRGSAFLAVGFFLAMRAIVSLFDHAMVNHTMPHFPLYVAEAAIVELLAVKALMKHRLLYGAIAGATIGSVGTLFEWWWSHIWMTLPWPTTMVLEALPLTVTTGIASGLIGASIAASLSQVGQDRILSSRVVFALSTVALLSVFSLGIPITADESVSASVTLDRSGVRDGYADVSVRIRPQSAVSSTRWIDVTAWQGGGLKVAPLVREGLSNMFVSVVPVPVTGQWKTILRLHRSDSLLAAPIYLPADSAINAKLVPASAHFTRPMVADAEILRREEIGGSPTIKALGYGVLASVSALWLIIVGWALTRRSPEPNPSSSQRESLASL